MVNGNEDGTTRALETPRSGVSEIDHLSGTSHGRSADSDDDFGDETSESFDMLTTNKSSKKVDAVVGFLDESASSSLSALGRFVSGNSHGQYGHGDSSTAGATLTSYSSNDTIASNLLENATWVSAAATTTSVARGFVGGSRAGSTSTRRPSGVGGGSLSESPSSLLRRPSVTVAGPPGATTGASLSSPAPGGGGGALSLRGSIGGGPRRSVTFHPSGSGAAAVARRLSEFTVDKLRFRELRHLYGRDHERDILTRAWRDVKGSSPVVAHGPSGAPTIAADAGAPPAAIAARRFVEIHGASGTGKSALADSLRDPVLRSGGFYLQGKFAQQMRLSRQAVEPYAAFISACLDLCDLVLAIEDRSSVDSPDTSSTIEYNEPFEYKKSFKFAPSDFKAALERELGKDASLLVKIIPGLRQILKAQDPADADPGLLEAQHQFKFAFRRFIRIVSRFGPVVLVLDDLQWADVASMELLESLLTDRESSRFLAIGCYRDDTEYAQMPHVTSLEKIRSHAGQDPTLQAESLTVGALTVEQLNGLLADLLSSQPTATLGLAECVHKKTLGNIFFVIQFLTLLQDSKLLEYNFGLMSWVWDVQQIHVDTAATENVVGFMYTKMKGFPASIRQALPIMACLGSSFSSSMFELVAKRFQWNDEMIHQQDDNHACIPEKSSPGPSDVSSQGQSVARRLLKFCEDQGLIEPTSNEGTAQFQWVHDKIQEAAFSLVGDDELYDLKLLMGKILLEDLDDLALESNLFTVANLLNTESSQNPSSLPRQEPLKVAELYRRAGVKAIENAAYEQATGYLLAGIALLPPNSWRDHYNLSLDLYSSAAEAHFCTGDMERMTAYCKEVIRQENHPILDKRRVYMVLIDATGAAGRQLEALNLCIDILSKLGIKFPKIAVKLHVVAGIKKFMSKLKASPPNELLTKLPIMYDPEKQWAMAVLEKLAVWSYSSKSDYLPLGIFKGFDLMLQHGMSMASPGMCVLFGLLLSGILFDFKKAVDFCDLAVSMLDQLVGSRKIESKIMFVAHGFVFCWLRPIAMSVKPLLAAYEIGLATGDLESGAWCIYFYLEYQFRMGQPLEDFIADCAFYAARLHELKMFKTHQVLRDLWQAALFLTGANSFHGTLTGDVVHQEAELAEAGELHGYMFVQIYRMLMYTQYVLGDHELVYESIKKTEMDRGAYEKQLPGIAGLYHLYAFNGYSMISLYRETKNKTHLRLAKKFAAKIKAFSQAGNPNVTHYDSLFDAEFVSLRKTGDMYAAAKSYEMAIVYAGRRGLSQDQALAHELFGEHLCRLGTPEHEDDAEFHLGQAVMLYKEWGAHAKVRSMKKKHQKILEASTTFQIDFSWMQSADPLSASKPSLK